METTLVISIGRVGCRELVNNGGLKSNKVTWREHRAVTAWSSCHPRTGGTKGLGYQNPEALGGYHIVGIQTFGGVISAWLVPIPQELGTGTSALLWIWGSKLWGGGSIWMVLVPLNGARGLILAVCKEAGNEIKSWNCSCHIPGAGGIWQWKEGSAPPSNLASL